LVPGKDVLLLHNLRIKQNKSPFNNKEDQHMTRVLLVSVLCLVVVFGVLAQTPTPLPAPTNLAAVQVNENTVKVRLTWDAPDSILSFRIYRSANDTNHYQNIGATNAGLARTFIDQMVSVGTQYFYYVKSVRGNQQSGRSNVVDILIAPPPPPTPPPTPTNLTATLVAGGPGTLGNGVKLVWNGGRGPWTYRVFRSAEDTLHYNTAGNTPETTFVDFGVHPGSHYYYFVRAFGMAGGQSGPSNVADIVVTAPVRYQGTINGTVIDDSTAAPIGRVNIQFFRVSSNAWHCPPLVMTDSLGRYSAVLDTGRYIIRANPMCSHNTGCYRAEYYDNCPEPSCATVVVLAESSTFTANFGLSRPTPPSYSYVSGTVNDTLNQPLRNARVSIVRTVQEMNFLGSLGIVPGTGDEEFGIEGVGHTRGVVWSGSTDSLGGYRARVIANRDYIAMASKQGFLPQYFDHKSTASAADIIHVSGDTSGINFNLAVRPIPNNSISGSVKDSAGVGVISRICLLPVRFGHPGPSLARYFHTDSLGNYTVLGLEAGNYFVLAMPFSNYAPGFYKANDCGIIHIQNADTVNVTGNVTGIDICVDGVHSDGLTVVRGTIRSSSNSVIAGVRMTALDAQGRVVGIGNTDSHGAYILDAVAPGVVTVVADREGYDASQLSISVNANVYSMDNVNITLMPNSPTSVGDPGVIPERFALDQNYPNPFNPDTKISYSLSAPSIVTLKVFNLLGQEVTTLVAGNSAAGTFQVVWNGKDNLGRSVSSGVYMYKLHATAGTTEFSQVRKMLLLK
jgi:fibronectin type 3 domain-containing protein